MNIVTISLLQTFRVTCVTVPNVKTIHQFLFPYSHTEDALSLSPVQGPDASGADKPAATTPPSSDPPEAHTQDRDSLKVAETVEEEEEKENGDALKLTETMDTARGGEAKQRPTPPDDRGIPPEQWAGHPAVPVSEPIVIKTGVRGRGRVGGRGEGGWRKRVSESLVDDSGEEEEVAQLTAGKLSGRLGSLGLAPPRDQPFSPMVNRCVRSRACLTSPLTPPPPQGDAVHAGAASVCADGGAAAAV